MFFGFLYCFLSFCGRLFLRSIFYEKEFYRFVKIILVFLEFFGVKIGRIQQVFSIGWDCWGEVGRDSLGDFYVCCWGEYSVFWFCILGFLSIRLVILLFRVGFVSVFYFFRVGGLGCKGLVQLSFFSQFGSYSYSYCCRLSRCRVQSIFGIYQVELGVCFFSV